MQLNIVDLERMTPKKKGLTTLGSRQRGAVITRIEQQQAREEERGREERKKQMGRRKMSLRSWGTQENFNILKPTMHVVPGPGDLV